MKLFYTLSCLAAMALPALPLAADAFPVTVQKEAVSSMSARMPQYNYRLATPKAEGAEPVCREVTLSHAGSLKTMLGDELNTIDELIVAGPVNEEDIQTMWGASFNGHLAVIDLSKATIEGNVIPEYAFWHPDQQIEMEGGYVNCIALEKLVLPESVTEIEKNAFPYAIFLKEINCPSSLKKIGERAFSECIRLASDPFVFNEGFEEIGNFAFFNCRELKEIRLSETVTKIGEGAFFQCKITKINFPESLKEIGGMAFYGCMLAEADLPMSNVVFNGEGQFELNYVLSKVHLPEGMKSLPASILSNCYSLTEVNLPVGVRKIGNGVLDMCMQLPSLSIPPYVQTIGRSAFSECSAVTEVMLPSTLRTIDAGSFENWKGVKKIYSAAKVPPVCLRTEQKPEETPFEGTPANTPLYVPAGTADAYRSAWGWSYFTNIIETEEFPSAPAAATLAYERFTYVDEPTDGLRVVGFVYDQPVEVFEDGVMQLYEGDCEKLLMETEAYFNTDVNCYMISADFGGIELTSEKGYTLVIPSETVYATSGTPAYNARETIHIGGSGVEEIGVETTAKRNVIHDLNGIEVRNAEPGGIYILNRRKYVGSTKQ